MKQFTLYITLLLGACCVLGAITQKSTINPSTTPANANATETAGLLDTTEKSCQSPGNRNAQHKDYAGHDGAMIMSKPKLVVTFLANSKPIDKRDEFGGGGADVPFMDPFHRLLQFFFSSIARDFSPAFPREEDSVLAGSSKDITAKVDNSSDFDWLAKNDEPDLFCEHGKNGFCRSCHMKTKKKNMLEESFRLKREKTLSTNKPEISNRTIATNSSTLSPLTSEIDTSTNNHNLTKLQDTSFNDTATTSTKLPPKTKKSENVKPKRHYFLSISGDTDPRVTAHKLSGNKRAKRDNIERIGKDNASFFKILEDTIFESLNKDFDGLRKTNIDGKKSILDDWSPNQKHANAFDTARQENNSESPVESDKNESSESPNDANEHEFYDFDTLPHSAVYSYGWTYFFLVTLPVVCTLAVLILFLCVVLRTRGWCCRLFLKDPAKTLEERNAKKKTKPTIRA